LGARLILQQALEDEVTEFLGRGRYERIGEPVSHRNGYEPRKVRTTSGTLELERPRVRDASRLGFESRLLGKHVTRTYALESLVIGSFLRGLSTRDVEAVLEETFDEPVSSRSTVSRILDDTRERYRRWCARRLLAEAEEVRPVDGVERLDEGALEELVLQSGSPPPAAADRPPSGSTPSATALPATRPREPGRADREASLRDPARSRTT
jgi:putative transposase